LATVGFGDPGGGLSVLLRAAHILAGITWIGLLYFFNFVQTPAFAQMSDGSRSEALRKITYRALWWFRYAALMTFLLGIFLLGVQSSNNPPGYHYLAGASGIGIMTGMLFGITMFLNVWGIIWRHQKVIIASAESVANGGEADPRAAALAKPAARASRCNTLMSITMLFFMVFAAHAGVLYHSNTTGGSIGYWILVLVLWAFIEGSALGLIGGFDSAFNKAAFDSHRNTLWFGTGLLAVIYFIGWLVLLKP
jgi:uncharacterized membrane protein